MTSGLGDEILDADKLVQPLSVYEVIVIETSGGVVVILSVDQSNAFKMGSASNVAKLTLRMLSKSTVAFTYFRDGDDAFCKLLIIALH